MGMHELDILRHGDDSETKIATSVFQTSGCCGFVIYDSVKSDSLSFCPSPAPCDTKDLP